MTIKRIFQAALLSICVLNAGQAWAHAHPKTEVPADGATVASPPEVSIVFDDALEPALSTLTVNDPQGHSVTAAKAELDASTHKSLHLNMPMLNPGIYEVKWVAVSLDGHRTSGAYHFTVK